MLIGKQDHPGIQTGDTGWISIHINEGGNAVDPEFINAGISSQESSTGQEACHLFEHIVEGRSPLADRFAGLIFVAVALGLVLSAVMAEIDYLRGAGYYWH